MIRSLSAIFLLSLSNLAHPADISLSLGTATPGGGFAGRRPAVADALREVDPGITLELRGTKGSRENIPLLASGKLDLALVEGTIVQETLEQGASEFLVVAAMYSSPGMFVVRADSSYRTISDLKGQRVVFLGAAGSGLTTLGGLVVDGVGLDMKKDFDAVLLESVKDGPPMVIEGKGGRALGRRIGLARLPGRCPRSARRTLHRSGRNRDCRDPGETSIPETTGRPRGSFPGQPDAVPTVGTWSFILARRGLPDDVAHRFARALHRAQPALGRKLPQAVEDHPGQDASVAAPGGTVASGSEEVSGRKNRTEC